MVLSVEYYERSVTPYHLCLKGLRRLIQIKNKELKQMKSLAATILSQRSETEQFFLESLQEVMLLHN